MRAHVLLAALLLLLTVSLAASEVAPAGPDRSSHSCVRGRELWFRAADRTRLVGHRFGTGTTAVILGHQSGGSLCEWVPYARSLARRGLFVFAFDFRGHGFSQHRSFPASRRLGADVTAAVKALRRLGKRKIVLVGASMGGLAAIVGAANARPAVSGVVALSSPDVYEGMNGVTAARRLRVPALYVAAADDRSGDHDFAAEARRLHAATASAEKRLEVVVGSDHGIRLLTSSDPVRTLVEDFIRSR